MANNIGISAGVYSSESDNSFSQTSNFSDTRLGGIFVTQKGRSFQPTLIQNYQEFVNCFGDCSPCSIGGQSLAEASLISREFLQESNALYVTRVLGLTGSNLGTAFGIVLGGSINLTTSELTGSTTFELTKVYNDGDCLSVNFSDPVLQTLYDCGEIECDEIGTINNISGDTLNLGKRWYGDCDTFTGADLIMELLSSEEQYLCITGSTTTGLTTTETTVTTSETVVFSAGTVTLNSTLNIDLGSGECSVSIVNQSAASVRIVESGIIQLNGGTITHELDGTLTITDGTILLSNGDVLVGDYKICDLACATVTYVGCPDAGTGYQCITSDVSGETTVLVTGTTDIITKTPSGIVTQTWSGVTNQYTAQPKAEFHNRIVATLRSKGFYDADQILQFEVALGNVGIQPVEKTISPKGDFKLAGIDRNGDTFEYTVSLDRTKRNFISRVFASGLQGLCCTNDAPIYVEEFYENMLNEYIEAGCVSCIKPKLICCGSLWNYQQQYTSAKTPWIVSEVQGGGTQDLFRFHTIGDGNAANSDIKVSIVNIKPDAGTFDVLVRRFADNDSNPVVLERYTRLTLDPTSNNYIARKIGDNDCFEGDGGCNIYVEMAANCLTDAFPAGFKGYPIRDYCGSQAPEFKYKTCYGDFEKKRKFFLGVTADADKDFFNYKGLTVNDEEWTGRTKGFHMDINADTTLFEVGCAEFQNDADLAGTDYDKINARKFTVNFYGGWDGWDTNRKEFTNKDTDIVRGSRGSNGLLSGAFDVYVNEDGETVINSDYYAWEKAIKTFRNSEDANINLFVTPLLNSTDNTLLVEEAIEMVEEERCDSLYIFTTLDTESDGETPLDADAIVSQIDGLYDSSYAATYVPHVKMSCNDSVTGNFKVWVPPTAAVVKSIALTDRLGAQWFAAAGVNRGRVNAENVRKNFTQDDRDTLYEGRINPIAKFNNVGGGNGIYIWGNKTAQIDESALDRINVRRLMLRLSKLIKTAAKNLVFDQNDEALRSQFLNIINPILDSIRVQRGLLDFRVEIDSIDESGDSNTLCGNIFIRPTRSAEIICVNYSVSNTETILG